MKLILSLAFSLILFAGFTQSKTELSLSFKNGQNGLANFSKAMGAPSYSGEGFYSVGLNYTKELKTWLSYETGLEYSQHKIMISPNLSPDMVRTSRIENTGLLTIPLACRLTFLKYAFLNGGFLFDIDSSLSNSIDNQSGIGILIGAGLKYSFKSGITLTINPCTRMHSVVAFTSDKYHDHLIDSGIKFGIGYRF